MSVFFNKTNLGFYPSDIYKKIPDGCVELTAEEYASLMTVMATEGVAALESFGLLTSEEVAEYFASIEGGANE